MPPLNETQTSETNNLKVSIGALKLAGRNEAKTSKAKRIEVLWPNYPIAKGYWKLSRMRSMSGQDQYSTF